MFFTFIQNNPSGTFEYNDTVCNFMIIEADDHEEANRIAETKGIYFDGTTNGKDCMCGLCEDRWHRVRNDEGPKTPEIYGKKPRMNRNIFTKPGESYCRIFYKNLMVEEYKNNRRK